jgi:hypothetical protein
MKTLLTIICLTMLCGCGEREEPKRIIMFARGSTNVAIDDTVAIVGCFDSTSQKYRRQIDSLRLALYFHNVSEWVKRNGLDDTRDILIKHGDAE